jgi:hypothetical protein
VLMVRDMVLLADLLVSIPCGVFVQGALVHAKSKRFLSLTDKLAAGIESNEELTTATEEAASILSERRDLEDLAARKLQAKIDRAKNKFRKIAVNGQLRDIAFNQMQEILQLSREKAVWVQRSFPSFAEAYSSSSGF